MMQSSSKNDDSALCYDVIINHHILKIDKFGDFSSDIDFKTKMDIFRYDISLIQLTNVTSRRPKGASGGHEVSASRAAQASEARLYIYIYIYIYTVELG